MAVPTQVNPVQQTARQQQRLNYLKRVRPNDPQIAQLQQKLQTPAQQQTNTAAPAANTATINPGRVQTRIDYLKRIRPNDPEIAKLQQQLTAYNAAKPATPAAPAPATPAVPNATQPQAAPGSLLSPMTQALMGALGKGANTMAAYEPKNFEGSPLYQFQKQKGMQDLEKLMASRGLTNSGAEIQANSDFLANLNATEAENQRKYAQQDMQRAQDAMQFIANYDQAERGDLTNRQQFEATRDDQRRALGVNFLNSLLNMQSQNNIASQSQAGLNSQTNLTQALMNAITNNIGANVPRATGGGTPPPPPPSSGASNAELAAILTGASNNAGNNDVLNSLIKSIFG